MHLSGKIFQSDGKTPLKEVLIESWQCDENEKYDNTSDEYKLRGATKTAKDGSYTFKTIVPVPYDDNGEWRLAHIHLRISSSKYQDLITQIYFKGDPHIAGDAAAASPESASRILEIESNSSHKKVVHFDVIMQEAYDLDDTGYSKITGLYQLENGMAEFIREDDLLMMKFNGQILDGLQYKGNNAFASGLNYNHVHFNILPPGEVKAKITLWKNWSQGSTEIYEGVKVLKYGPLVHFKLLTLSLPDFSGRGKLKCQRQSFARKVKTLKDKPIMVGRLKELCDHFMKQNVSANFATIESFDYGNDVMTTIQGLRAAFFKPNTLF